MFGIVKEKGIDGLIVFKLDEVSSLDSKRLENKKCSLKIYGVLSEKMLRMVLGMVNFIQIKMISVFELKNFKKF
jgi:hypothetical protein